MCLSLYQTPSDLAQEARRVADGDRVACASLLLYAVVALAVACLVWASCAELEEVTRGHGKVIPSSSIQTIQNLEGGILAELLVREGDPVVPGTVLARIDDTQSAATYREDLTHRDALDAALSRFDAEAHGSSLITFSRKIQESRPDLAGRETLLFEKRRSENLRQRENAQSSLELAREELAMVTPMVAKRVSPRTDQLRLEREVNELEDRLAELTEGFQSEAMEAYNETKAKLESLEEALRAREDRVNRALVRSPVKGTVNRIHINTVGGVVQPGEPIMDLVPLDDTLLVQAKVKPQDIAFVRPEQEAVVRFTAYDSSLYGGLKGAVEHISADTIEDEVDRQHYYHVNVRITGQKLVKNGQELPILPGMVAEADVITGRRTVLQYLLKPLHRARLTAMRER